MWRYILFFFLFVTKLYAQPVTLDLQNTRLPDAIRLVAQFLNINVILSPAVHGEATLSLQEASPREALDLLLVAHGLVKWREGNVWYIAPHAELLKRKQEALQWQEMSVDTAPLVTQVWQIKYGNARDIVKVIRGEHTSMLSKRGQVQVDARTNVICVQDIASRIAMINRLVVRLDVPVRQILIEARLASVDNDFERALGIDFSVQQAEDGAHPGLKTANSIAGRYGIAVAKLADGSLLDVKLAALENAGHAQLISSPSLFAANQQAASIEAGEEVPYQEVSESGGTAVVFKKAVLGLRVVPQVLPGNKVLLRLQINQDRPSHKMVLGMPVISTRQINTNVMVRAGQTIVLGGIYENNHELVEQRVPFISKIPILGWLFTERDTRDNRRELLIFVTPKIMA